MIALRNLLALLEACLVNEHRSAKLVAAALSSISSDQASAVSESRMVVRPQAQQSC